MEDIAHFEPNPAAVIGGNNPPEPTLAEVLAKRHAAILASADALIAAKDRLPEKIPLDDPEDADGKTILGRVTAMVLALRKAEKALDTTRAVEKATFDEMGRTVQNLFTPKQVSLKATKTRCETMIAARNNAAEAVERERRAALATAQRQVEIDRLASAAKLEAMGHADVAATVLDAAQDSANLAEKMERAAGGTAADMVRVATGEGTVSSGRRPEREITDHAALRATLGPLGEHFTTPEIEKALRAFDMAERKVGRTPALAGVVFTMGSRAIVRG